MYQQNFTRSDYEDSPSTEYRSCLDAVIAGIADLDELLLMRPPFDARLMLQSLRDAAEERASDLAYRIFRRWIDVVPQDTDIPHLFADGRHSGMYLYRPEDRGDEPRTVDSY